MFNELKRINIRPEPFQYYTAEELWTNAYTSTQMLKYHLHEFVDAASRNSAFIESSVDWIAERFGVSEATAIADFGCGPGLYASRLAKKGTQVTGIDFSANSLEYARKEAEREGLSISYIQANYLDYTTKDRFDLIVMIMCDYCALSPQQRKTLLGNFSSLLKPGGAVLLDVNSLVRFDQKEEAATYELNQLGGFWSPEDYYCFVNSFKYDDAKLILDKYVIFDEASVPREVYNWQQCYSEDMLKREFEASGFKIDAIYSDVAGQEFNPESAEIAVVAKTTC